MNRMLFDEPTEEPPHMSRNKRLFEEARKIYPGVCRGFDEEWANFLKESKSAKWKSLSRTIANVAPLLKPAIEAKIAHNKALIAKNQPCEYWKHFLTWINGGWWTEDVPQTGKPKRTKCGICGKPSTRGALAYYDDGAATVYRCDDCEFPENVR